MLINSAASGPVSTRAFFWTTAGITLGIIGWALYMSVNYTQIPLTGSFFYLFTALDQPAAAVSLLVLTAAALIARPAWTRPVAGWVSDHVGAITLLTAVAFSAGSLLVYQNHPLAMDEYAAYFQSQIFAAGHLSGQFPVALIDSLIAPPFQGYFLHVSHATGAVVSAYWPAFALLLTPFTWLGIPWACNPIISALTVLAIHRVALQWFEDREAAGFAVLLTLASPVFFAEGISYYSMPAHLLANTVYALLLLRPTPLKALLAGLTGSIALTLHNPIPHLLFALPWFLWIARQTNPVRLLLCLCAGYLPLCVLLGIGWFEFETALQAAGTTSSAGTHSLIERVADLIGSIFSLPDAVVLYARVIGLAKIWVWAVPGLMVLAVAGAWKLRGDPRCRLFVAAALATLVGYLLVPVDQGHGWGFRYFHSAWMVLPLLAAGVLTRVRTTPAAADRFANDDLPGLVTACALLSLIIGVSHRAVQIHQYIADDLAEVPQFHGAGRQVIFINPGGFYATDLVQNDPWLRGNIRLLSRGLDADADLMRAQFPQMKRVYDDPHGSVWATPQ